MRALGLKVTLLALLLACDPPMAGEPLADPLPGQDRYSGVLFAAGSQACLSHSSAEYGGYDQRVDCLADGALGALPALPPPPSETSPRNAATYTGLADGGVQVTQLLSRLDQTTFTSDYPVLVLTLGAAGWEQRLAVPPSVNPDAGWVSMPGYSTATTDEGEVFVTLENGSVFAFADGTWVDRSVTDGRRAISLTSGVDGRAYAVVQGDAGLGSMVEWLDGGWVDLGPEGAVDPYAGGYYYGDDPRHLAAGNGRYLLAQSGYYYGYSYGYAAPPLTLRLFSSAGVEEFSPPESVVPLSYSFAVTLTDSGDPVVAVATADGVRLATRSGGQWSVLADRLAGGAGPRRQSALVVRSIAGRLVVAWTEREQPPYPLGLFSRGGPARIFVRRF